MTVVEERLVRDIEAVTQDIVLTESDLVAARAAVGQRLDSRKQRDRRSTVLAAAAAALLIPAAGIAGWQSFDDTQGAPPANPAPTAPIDSDNAFVTGQAPTPELLDGVWTATASTGVGGTHMVVFTADRTVRLDMDGLVFRDPYAVGSYAIEGNQITMTFDGGRGCQGQRQPARAALPEPGTLRLVFTEDTPTEHCSTTRGERLALERLLPPSDAIAQRTLPKVGSWGAAGYESQALGTWMPVGGGHLLDIRPGGSYVVLGGAGAEVDRGRWSLSLSPSRLVMTSSASSPTCTAGDRFELGGLERYLGVTAGLRGSAQRNDCGGAWAADAWLRVGR